MKKTFLIVMLTMILVVFFGCKPNHEHDYKETKVEPSCTEQGYIEFKCECGDSYKDNFVKAKGHLFGEWVVVKEATVTEEGQKMRTCECGEKETEKIDKLSNSHTHSFGEWEVVKEATESEEGLKEKVCSCGEKETEPIEKLEHIHNFVDGKCSCGEEEHVHNYVDGKCACGGVETLLVKVYESDNESKELNVNYGEKINGLENPIKEGHRFIGWFLDSDYNQEFNLNSIVTSNITLYAKYEVVMAESITISGDSSLYLGYSQLLKVEVLPKEAYQDVYFEIHNASKSLCEISEDGKVTALKDGNFRVRAVSKYYSNIKSSYFTITVTSERWEDCGYDLHGYEVIILAEEDKIDDIDSFLEGYKSLDKLFKQRAWNEVEEMYNCRIVVKPYPEDSLSKVSYIKKLVKDNELGCDIALVSQDDLLDLAKENVIYDYNGINISYMNDAIEEMCTYDDVLYGYQSNLYMNQFKDRLGLVYDYDKVQELEIDSPSKLYNEGKWTYSGFTEWVKIAQRKLGENEYVLGGDSYNYWVGLSNSAGLIIGDSLSKSLNINNDASEKAANLISELVKEKAFSSDSSSKALMIDANYQNNISGTLGFVPFPYPDNMLKEDTFVTISNADVFVNLKNRPYPSEINGFKQMHLMYIIVELMEKTQDEREKDPFIDDVVSGEINNRYKDPDTEEAVLYYNKARFEAVSTPLFKKTEAHEALRSSIDKVVFEGADYVEELNAIYDSLVKEFNSIYNSLNIE